MTASARSVGNRERRVAGVIARIWHGWTTQHNAESYERFLRASMFPSMDRLDGYRGVYLLEREDGDEVEFVTVTLWDSVDVLRAFAGDDYEQAVVEPEARAVLSHFDERSVHYEVRVSP
jgi:heme-degrading monooxygenase HmoA